jgi:hypothetical protein
MRLLRWQDALREHLARQDKPRFSCANCHGNHENGQFEYLIIANLQAVGGAQRGGGWVV